MGIEPTTYSLGSCRSTTELRPRVRDSTMQPTPSEAECGEPAVSLPQTQSGDADDSVGMRHEAVELGGESPVPFEVIEEDVGARRKVDRRSLRIKRGALVK